MNDKRFLVELVRAVAKLVITKTLLERDKKHDGGVRWALADADFAAADIVKRLTAEAETDGSE